MVLLKARVVDRTHLELTRPILASEGEFVLVSVAMPDDLSGERAEWEALSAEGLARAYGPDEPDYTAAMVKEANPEYEL
jgi:hypothetical protein